MIPTAQEAEREVRYRHERIAELRREGAEISEALLALARRLAVAFELLRGLVDDLEALAGTRTPPPTDE